MSIPKGKSSYKKSSSFTTYLQGLFSQVLLFWDATSMETGLPLSVFWLVHLPSTGSCTTTCDFGRGNRPRKHRFPRKFRPQIWTLLFSNAKKHGWNGDSAARGRGASFELLVDWGLGNPSYTWEIRVYSRVYSLMETSESNYERIIWNMFFVGSGVPSFGYIGQYTTYAGCIYIYTYHSPFRCVPLLDPPITCLVHPTGGPFRSSGGLLRRGGAELTLIVVHKWNTPKLS